MDIEQFEESFRKASEETFGPLIHELPEITDENDFFPGRRFVMESYTPLPFIVFLEMEYSLKKHILSTVFNQDWIEIADVIRDDCMLEILNMIVRKHICNLEDTEKLRFRSCYPQVIYDEYEDNFEVSTLDLYRFDFRMTHGRFALILTFPPGPYLENSCV